MREKLQKIDYKILVLIILVLPMEQIVKIKQINMNITYQHQALLLQGENLRNM